ncbi:MAG TPA: lipopolysaccharide biosynthesis protein [Noviherbaspirillum sp.]|nr:lipopolysaccharide biosynthesis protein [Noviherbaspirillum sp.]
MQSLNSAIRRVLPANAFARRVVVLAGGNVLAQAITVAVAPILTRLYSVQDFGLMAVFVTLLSLVSVVGALRYEQAIPMPEDDKEAASLLVLSLLVLIAITGLAAIPLMMWRFEIAALLKTPALSDYMVLVPIGALLAGLYSTLNRWAVRRKAFAPLASTRMSQAFFAAAIQLAGAKLGALALLLGQVAGQGGGSVSLLARVLRKDWSVVRSVRARDVLSAARTYRKYPMYSTWTALCNTVGSQLPSVMFAAFFGPAAAGIYLLANRVLSAPMQLVGQAIGNVFLADAPAAMREGRLGAVVAKVHARLAHIGMPPMLVLLVAGPEIFAVVFGESWRQAGVFAQWLAPWLYLVFITSPMTSIFLVLERQVSAMAFQVVLLSVRAAAIAAGAWMDDLMAAVALFALGSTACWLANLAWMLRCTGNGWGRIVRPALSALAWAVVLASPLIFGTVMHIDRTLWLLSFGAAFLLVLTRYAWLMKGAWS